MVYKEVIVMLVPNRIIVRLDHENSEVVIISSPMKLIVGGSARLAKLAIIHSTAISGKIV